MIFSSWSKMEKKELDTMLSEFFLNVYCDKHICL